MKQAGEPCDSFGVAGLLAFGEGNGGTEVPPFQSVALLGNCRRGRARRTLEADSSATLRNDSQNGKGNDNSKGKGKSNSQYGGPSPSLRSRVRMTARNEQQQRQEQRQLQRQIQIQGSFDYALRASLRMTDLVGVRRGSPRMAAINDQPASNAKGPSGCSGLLRNVTNFVG
jgi:hypothetical protein